VDAALSAGDVSSLPVLGSGEISVVLGAPAERPVCVCKRLPPFRDSARADHYAATITRYITELTARGVRVLDTTVRRVDRPDGSVVLYCVQPALPVGSLAVDIARHDPHRIKAVIEEIVATVARVVDDRFGLDAQLSNWAIVDGCLVYFDITTPLMRSAGGSTELDSEVLIASLPWALRPPVRRWVVPDILQRYHAARTVVLDLAANLMKERLDALIPAVLAAADGLIEPPLTQQEVGSDYRSDARTWAALQAVRRADRMWQRRVRRRSYPFLIPARIER
jgi:hypothetical protein